MLLAAEGDFGSPSLLARRAGLSAPLVLGVITDLEAESLCLIRRDPYSSLEAAPTDETYLALREHFDDLYLRRPDAIAVYVRVPEEIESQVALAAGRVLASEEHVVIAPSSAPSVMEGPELAFKVNAPTIRRALGIARDLWMQILEEAGMESFEPVIANVIPPGSRPIVASTVLDTFMEAAIDAGVANGEALREIRSGYSGGTPEAELAARSVTMAATALRRMVGNVNDPRPIRDGDSAFAELQPASGVPVGREATRIKNVTVGALELATDRLGPIAGGRLASFRAPGRSPQIVHEVRPSGADLIDMARLSGEAVGLAAALGKLDACAALRRIIAGD
jgi:hypothetical protein